MPLQEEKLDESNVQVAPPGFHVIFLPFAEDLRKLQFEEDAPKGVLGVCKLRTNQLQIPLNLNNTNL